MAELSAADVIRHPRPEAASRRRALSRNVPRRSRRGQRAPHRRRSISCWRPAKSRTGIASMPPRSGTGTPAHRWRCPSRRPTAIATDIRLGADLAAGERPQGVVPPGYWQSASSLGAWTLVGCTVAPGFEFAHFELAAARIFSAAPLRCCLRSTGAVAHKAHKRVFHCLSAGANRAKRPPANSFLRLLDDAEVAAQGRLTKKSPQSIFHGHAGGCRL